MSMPEISVMVPPRGPVPPGAAWAGHAVSWLFGGDARIRTGLPAWWEAVRTRLAVDRAARREARSRLELLALARSYESSQPAFAKDLLAAANNDCGR